VVGPDLALDIVDVFLSTAFEGGRHVPRITELRAIEDEEAAGGV
jgi:ribose 5-phosphate isomerase B